MIENLKEAIAQKLMHSTIGMTLKELAESMPESDFDGDRDRISSRLNTLKSAGFVEKTAGFNNSPVRWKITAQGRANYSECHHDQNNNERPILASKIIQSSLDDRAETMEKALSKTTHQQPAANLMASSDEDTTPMESPKIADADTIRTHEAASFTVEDLFTIDALKKRGLMILNPNDADDWFYYNIVQRLKNSDSAAIKRKPLKMATLQMVQKSIGFFNSQVQEIIAEIIADLENLDENFADLENLDDN